VSDREDSLTKTTDVLCVDAAGCHDQRCRKPPSCRVEPGCPGLGGQMRPPNDITNTQQSAPVAVSAPNPMPSTIVTSLQPQSAPTPYYTALQPAPSQSHQIYGMPSTGMPIYQSGQIMQQLGSYVQPSQQPCAPCQPDGPLPQFTYPMMANPLTTATAHFFQPPAGVNSQTVGSAQ
jgi:hypothetical protein